MRSLRQSCFLGDGCRATARRSGRREEVDPSKDSQQIRTAIAAFMGNSHYTLGWCRTQGARTKA